MKRNIKSGAEQRVYPAPLLRGKSGAGFTLVEVAVSMAIIAILVAVGIVGFVSLQKKSDVANAAEEIANVLKLARSKTVSFELNSRYGVYFDSASSPGSYTLFKGNDYSSREILADKVYFLPDAVEFSSIDFQGGNELVFNRLSGSADNWGYVSVRLKNDVSEQKSVYLSNLGVVGFDPPPSADDTARLKDSRHAHVTYLRLIDTGSEYIVLTSEGNPVSQIAINPNLIGGQFEWEGTVVAGGQDQTIKIHTHWLNDPVNDTQFSVHRDKRFNNAPLEISLSGDATGNIIEYSYGPPEITGFSSFYVLDPPGPEWQ